VFGTAASSPSAQTCSWPSTRSVSSTFTPAALVERHAEPRELGARLDAGRPDERVRQDPLAVRECCRAGVDGFQGRLDVDLDAALDQLARRILAEPRRDLGEDLGRGVDEHPALRRVPESRVVANRVPDQVGELCKRLDARVAGADEDEAQLALPVGLVRGDVGRLQALQHVVAELDRVGEVLEAERVVGEPGIGSAREIEPTASTRSS
jgi:hypothetical protein